MAKSSHERHGRVRRGAPVALLLAVAATGAVASCAEGGEVQTEESPTGGPGSGSGGASSGSGPTGAGGDCVPSDEKCNAADDDCDGLVDEEQPNVLCADPNAHGVINWLCDGTCSVESCIMGKSDLNGDPADGCECDIDNHATTCESAGTTSVPVLGDATWTGYVETADGSDWMTFSFALPAASAPFHQKIELADSGGAFAMDVMNDCASAPAGCSTTGTENDETAAGVLVWEQNFNQYMVGMGCCTDSTPRLTSVKVRVFRKNGDQPQCVPYVVTASSL